MPTTQYRNAIVLVLDFLNANMLGAYGNTWVETPNFDRLAGESLVFEQAIANSVDLTNAYDHLWNTSGTSLIQRLGESGTTTDLLSDEETLLGHPAAKAFDNATQVRPSSGQANGLAETIDQTELAHFFAQASQWISNMERGSLGWLHSKGLGGAWDAPYSLRTRLADSEDPDPPHFHLPSSCVLRTDDDPDKLLGFQQACAAQVVMVDEFLGILLDMMESDSRGDSTLLVVTSSRGFPLGQHLLVGKGDESVDDGKRLHNESVHLPLLIRLPKGEQFQDFRSTRIGNIVQSSCLPAFLQKWFVEGENAFREFLESSVFSFPNQRKEWAITRVGSALSIQTHAWKLIRDLDALNSREQYQLFAKPDDIWETNDVSRRCPDIVEQLSEMLDRFEKAESEKADSAKEQQAFELPEELAMRFD